MDATPGIQAASILSGRVWWMPPDGALHGLDIDRLMQWNLLLLGSLFLLAHILILVAIFRPKQQSSPAEMQDTPRTIWRSELLPLVVIALLYAWMALTAHRLWDTVGYQGAAPRALQVEVTGVQFQWYFRYPGTDGAFGTTHPELVNAPAGNPLGIDRTDPHSSDDIVSSVLMLPVNHEVDLRLRSIDVIHGFFIPGMRLKQDAIPGMEMHLHFTPSAPGDYAILCSQVCGSGHARMQTHLHVVSEEAFQQWLTAHTRRAANAATSATKPSGGKA
jgi:cytochrome c oxidase subunit II